MKFSDLQPGVKVNCPFSNHGTHTVVSVGRKYDEPVVTFDDTTTINQSGFDYMQRTHNRPFTLVRNAKFKYDLSTFYPGRVLAD